MTKYKVLRDTRGRPLYVGYGDYRAHIGQLSFRSDVKQRLHAAFLKAQYLLSFGPDIKKTPFQSLPALLPSLFSAPIQSALFYDTSWHKETKYIGVVRTFDNSYFVKVHTKPEECLFEEGQTRFVREMFSGSFITAPLISGTGNALVYQLIKRLRSVTEDDHVEDRLLHVTKTFLETQAVNKSLAECVPLDLFALCFGTAYADLGKKIRNWIERNDQQIRHIPVHGDMTPWNMFITDEEKIVLIDYERAGWQVPFYDLFHYVLQENALKKNVYALKKNLYRKPWFHPQAMHSFLILYLIDQFYLDLTDHKMKGFNHKALMNLIETKKYWLEKLLDE